MRTEATKALTTLTMSQVTSRAGVRPDTVRYYERIGLLPTPARTTGAHRRYDEDVIDRLRFIRGTQRLGLTLTEIGDLLSVRDTGVCPCEPAETMLERHLAEIEAEMARLGELHAELTSMLSGMSGAACADPLPGAWCPPECEPEGGGG
ncbi:heavy metal-responsive transcriptional regulator [Amycolatopsis sp. WAC 04169]|uniref:heavy metal-responsive transcriptional regulator n=1 Tax=Amycolatopsis sp. WAC 04169 TaxID=2203197 RepID=UPI000F766D6B|nr:heavy metal-responsive transcriptional regulator [Amycolatopsis sp. WAC 04169]RSN23481.1 heavy metal-responsive transcriptional regulator [Amycolatopsis sp. WAC 04169]